MCALSDLIEVRGIRALGRHGLLPEEKDRPQPFEIDLRLDIDLAAAGKSDRLDDTVDYGILTLAVARVVELEEHHLLERLAIRVAETCKVDPRVLGAEVTVRKLRPPIGAFVDSVAVTIRR